jgi:hypothetical protein
MILNRIIPTLLVLCVAASPATRPSRPILARDEAALGESASTGPKIVCLSEDCRDLIPAVRKAAVAEGWRSVCVIRREGYYVYADGWPDGWYIGTFEDHAAECWPDTAIIYVVNAIQDLDDDEDT